MENRTCPLCHRQKPKPKFKVENFQIVACRTCGFVYLANPIDLQEEQQNYDDYFKSAELQDYTPNSADEQIKQAWTINEQRIEWMKEFPQTGTILDIGCGRGFFLHHARNAGYEGKGVEISRLAGRYASEQFDLTVHICNLDKEINFEGSFDIITMWHVLEHFNNPETALQNVWSLLKPGGRLFIEVPNLRSLKFQLSPAHKKWRGGNHPKYHRSFFTRSSLHQLLEACGFTNIIDSHITYLMTKKSLVYHAKQVLNSIYRDSFLNTTATK